MKPKFDRKLAEGLHFSAEDLAANRQGNLTERQIPVLKHKQREHLMSHGFVVLFFGAVGLAPLTVVAARDVAGQSRLCAGALLLGFIAAVLFLINESVRFWGKVRADMQQGFTETMQGRVILKESGRGGKVSYVTYAVIVNDSEFKVDEVAFRRFKNLEYYRLYYAPNSRTILSAEPMEGD